MRRLLALAAAFFLFVGQLSAQQIKIDPMNHVANVGAGYCGHCCIETIGRHYGYPQTFNRVTSLKAKWGDYGGLMYDSQICDALATYGIPYWQQARGSYGYDWLNWACTNGYPCIVFVKYNPEAAVGHYLTVVGFYSDYVGVIDCNACGKTTWLTRDEFKVIWAGGFIVVYPFGTKASAARHRVDARAEAEATAAILRSLRTPLW